MEKTKEKKPVNKKKAALMLAALVAAGGIGVGGAAAYFSATSATKDNNISIVAGQQNGDKGDGINGQDPAEIKEPEWDKEDDDSHKNLQPGDTLVKDPHLESNVAYDSYAMVEVTVPKVNARQGDEKDLSYQPMVVLGTGTKDAPVVGTAAAPKTNDDWKLVQTDNLDSKNADPVKYYFVYTGKLAADSGTTDPVFTTIQEQKFTEVNLGDNKLKSVDGDIKVRAAIIQTTDQTQPTGSETVTADGTVKTLYDALKTQAEYK